jgi:dynein heavy chain 2
LLKAVLFANGLLTSEIIEMGLIFIKDQVPPKWTNLWEGPDSVSLWLKGFCKKITALKKWIERTTTQKLLLETLNLSELFHPEVFLNALRQKTARKLNEPLNTLKLQVDFDAGRLKSPIIVKLGGLLLQGCGFQNNMMVDPPANLQEFTSLPTLAVCFVAKSSPENYPKDQLAVPYHYHHLGIPHIPQRSTRKDAD